MALGERLWTARGGGRPGSGLLPGTAIIPHYAPSRIARVARAVEDGAPLRWIGLDEQTLVIGRPGERWTVAGRGRVHVIPPGSLEPALEACVGSGDPGLTCGGSTDAGGSRPAPAARASAIVARCRTRPPTARRGSSSATSRSSTTARSGRCPAPVLEAQRVWRERMEAEPVRFLDRELEPRMDEVRQRGRAVPERRSRGHRVRAQRDDRRVHGARLAAVPARRRAPRGRPRVQRDAQRACAPPRPATARGSSSSGCRSRSSEPSQAVEAYLQAVTAADAVRPREPRHLAHGARAAGRARSCASSTAAAWTRSWTAPTPPGMLDVDLGRARRRRTGPATRTSGCARRRASGCSTSAPTCGPGSGRWSSRTARRRRPGRPAAVPRSSSTGRAPSTRRRTCRCPPRSATSAGCTTTAGRVHGGQPVAGEARPRRCCARPSTCRRRRRRHGRRDGVGARCPASPRRARRRSGSRPRCSTRTGSRSRS